MDHHALHELIAQVKAGRLDRRAFVQTMVGLGLTAPLAAQMLAVGRGRARPAQGARVHPDEARRRRAAQDPLVAGAHAAEPALRHRHQGPGRLPDLLRAAGRLRPRRQRGPGPGRGDPERAERRARSRSHLGHLAPQEGRDVARRQAVHRRRRHLHLRVRLRPGHRRGEQRLLPRDLEDRRVDSHTVKVVFNKPQPFWADRVLRQPRRSCPSTSSSRSRGPRAARRPPTCKPVGTGPYRLVDFKPGDMVRGEREPRLPRARTARSSTPRDEGRRRRGLRRARGAADRRVRLRLEPAGGGRHPAAHRAGRQGPRQHLAHRQPRAHPVQLHRPVDRGGGRAVARQDHASRPRGPRGAPGAQSAGGPRRGAGGDLRPGRADQRQLPQCARRATSRRTPAGSSTSTRPTRCSTRRAGSGAPTGSGPRTASA